MDIEQTKKMNLMIKELTKSGRVSSFNEAITQANQIYSNAMPESNEKRTEMPKEVSKSKVEQSMKKEHLEASFKDLIKQNNQAIATEMKKIWDYLRLIKTEMEEIKTKAIVQPIQKEAQKQKTLQTVTIKTEEHPRQGNFSPENVELENYFYFGNR